jgi:beta-lactam-binding protein with PASTA domain
MRALGVIVLAMFTSILATVGTMYGAYRLGYLKLAAESPRHAPNVLGLTEGDARNNIEALGLKLIIAGRETNAQAKENTVISQMPKAGDPVGPDGAVHLTLALAPPPAKVPDVTGKSVADATKALADAGYEVKVGAAVPHDVHKEGVVATQSPEAGGSLAAKETVTITPSSGAEAKTAPKFVGLGLDAAKEAAKTAKVELVVQWVALAETPTYLVLRQDPLEGKPLNADKKVTVFVNR